MKYELLIIPIITAIITQFIIKPIISIMRGNFSWSSLLHYGGMPSSHSALVSSLSAIMYLYYGFDSFQFTISFFLAIIVITDAIGLRGYITDQSKTINKLIEDLPDDLEYKYKVMNERIAHTIKQVIFGILTGIIITYILYIL